MTHEDYVSFEQAKALKELGFDWECQAYFEDYVDELNRHHRKFRFNAVANDMLHKDFCSAPTLGQAQKWLREEKGIALNIIALDGGQYHWESIFLPEGPEFDDFIGPDNRLFPTYELALSAGIDEALELLKEQKK